MKWTFFACFSEKSQRKRWRTRRRRDKLTLPVCEPEKKKKSRHQGQRLWGPRSLPFPCGCFGVFSLSTYFFTFSFSSAKELQQLNECLGSEIFFSTLPSLDAFCLYVRESRRTTSPKSFFFHSFFVSHISHFGLSVFGITDALLPSI